MLDLVIRGGRVVDGTGAVAIGCDVGVEGGVIVAVAQHLEADAATVIDASGCVVTPGFVDVHTHFDGQATWDGLLEPASSHGVTTVVTGNCGVGFAPVRPGREEQLVELMEGVEDIPGTALHEGITWAWESFPEYLDCLERRRWSMDLATQLPHGPLRAYVMGERGSGAEPPTGDEVREMARLAREAAEAGAFSFTTSRTAGHMALDGSPVPGTYAGATELLAIGDAVRDGGGRLLEVAVAGIVPWDDPETVAGELDWMGALATATGLTVSFTALQMHPDPGRWRKEMDAARTWRERGANVVPLIAGRPFGMLFNWQLRHPFQCRPTFRELAALPWEERLERLGRPEVRRAIVGERSVAGSEKDCQMADAFLGFLPGCYVLGDPPDYEPPPSSRLGARFGYDPADPADPATLAALAEAAYDALLADDGNAMLMYPLFNYADGNEDVLREQMDDADAVIGLDDAGAHCAMICDASIPTYLLTHWVRDRTRGRRLRLEEAVRRLTSQTADLYGLSDRGRVAVGRRADLNVIDLDRLRLHAPRVVADLPAGGLRLVQDATGYRATIVAGEVTRLDGSDTGARPGRLVRRAG